MTARLDAERLRDVQRLLEAARAVYEGRSRLVPDLVRTTGLTAEGVELGFQSLEREASEDELGALVCWAGDASRVHVLLSANVFVAPLRAIAIARAAAPVVTVRPSPRDPVVGRALVEAVRDPRLTVVEERDVTWLRDGEIHVYGRDETLASVRAAAAAGVVVRGHGPGMGVAVVTAAAKLEEAADALARDVVAFDQRGCLSPRIAFVEGDAARARSFAGAMHQALGAWEARVPRGELSNEERTEIAIWRDTLAFAGELHAGSAHSVAVGRSASPSAVPPAGRNLVVRAFGSAEELRGALAPLAAHVVSVGTDDVERARALAPPHARLATLGRMQMPPLDGPVDRR